jgi:tripartite-type tricarboxylate transporter receptor subunit TctC
MTPEFKTGRRMAIAAVAATAAALLARPAAAQSAWPNKPVRIVVPFAPGGTTDILARAIAPELSKAFGQQFVVENRAGAGGNVGADVVAKARLTATRCSWARWAHTAINKWLYARMPFDPQKDFVPITLVAGVPNVMVVNTEKAARRAASAPWKIS